MTMDKPETVVGNKEEQQYLDLVKRIIDEGETRLDRTSIGTKSIFAPPQLVFDLSNGAYPLLTTKRVFFKGVAEELLFFIKGQTDNKILKQKGVNIWNGNSSRPYLDKIGLTDRREDDLGPVYGFQWRHFGAKYSDSDADYTGQGYDQLQSIIDTIKKNPFDRRLILSAWNPSDLKLMVLPPCHMFAQFYVKFPATSDAQLDCQFYQRSCDMGLGVPFNIASYALLTILIAHVAGINPGKLYYCMGDSHVYLNHIDPLLIQTQRTPNKFPKLRINKSVSDINDFQFSDFELDGYNPQEKIKMDMAV
ncbi:Thymidylate synthase [Smittium culicis]|uniref:thymidylate synthase n=1 Tax=Smittium culicis TaxID=133412 RepID=A0A1R1YJM2_9FUNG|nr:Thymidylate synthase [Smittium culicis]